MEYCADHKECTASIIQLCKSAAVQSSKLDRVEQQADKIQTAIFGEGESDSIKSRLQKVEDETVSIEKLVLENRDVVSEKIGGLFKIFCLTIGAACLIITIAFGVMWSELKAVNDAMSIMHHHQIREPSPSPALPSDRPFGNRVGVLP